MPILPRIQAVHVFLVCLFLKEVHPMKRGLWTLVALLFLASMQIHGQAGNLPGAVWMQLGSPQQAGWHDKDLAKIGKYIEEIGSTSAMIVQHGVVVAAWGDVKHKSNLHSGGAGA
jgi:hypothetical protein